MEVSLTAADGHHFGAVHLPAQSDAARGGLVILQEIFGLTSYVRDTAQHWASRGFDVVAPSLFDRQSPGAVIDYGAPEAGKALASGARLPDVRQDVDACRTLLLERNAKVGVLGFCWGGGLAYWAACAMTFDAAACVYPTRLNAHMHRSPECPLQFHFAASDAHTPPEVRDAATRAAPSSVMLEYPADHGFDRKTDTPCARAVREELRKNIEAFFAATLAPD